MNTIAINGSSGFLGSQIIQFLKGKYKIITLNRTDYLLPPDKLAQIIEGSDYVINLAGSSINSLWTRKIRNEIYSSRITTTQNLVESFRYLHKKPKLFISASGVNIYCNGKFHSEDSVLFGDGFLSQVCMEWERAAINSLNFNIPAAIVRTGIVLNLQNGFLNQINKTSVFKFLVKFGKSHHSFPFIHLVDYLNALQFILQGNYSGIYNFVAPFTDSYSKFYEMYGKRKGCWFVVKVPSLFLWLLPGKQRDLLLNGPAVYPKKLEQLGFAFTYPSLEMSINALT